MQTSCTLALRFHGVRSRRSGRRATDVERTHRQLRARLTDGLCGDNANRFTHVDAMTTREVTAVTLRAHAVANFAGDRRTHLHEVNAFLLQHLDHLFVDQGAGSDDDCVASRTQHVFRSHATEHALAETFDDVTAF